MLTFLFSHSQSTDFKFVENLSGTPPRNQFPPARGGGVIVSTQLSVGSCSVLTDCVVAVVSVGSVKQSRNGETKCNAANDPGGLCPVVCRKVSSEGQIPCRFFSGFQRSSVVFSGHRICSGHRNYHGSFLLAFGLQAYWLKYE